MGGWRRGDISAVDSASSLMVRVTVLEGCRVSMERSGRANEPCDDRSELETTGEEPRRMDGDVVGIGTVAIPPNVSLGGTGPPKLWSDEVGSRGV